MVVAGSEDKVPVSLYPIRIQFARDLGIWLARAIVVHHEEQVASQQPYVDVSCTVEKVHHLPVEEIAVARVNNLCNIAGTVYFILQKHQMSPRVVTHGPHTMKPELGLCVVAECTPECDAHHVYAVDG